MKRELKFRAWDKKLLIMLPQNEMSCHKDFLEFGSRATLFGFLNNPDYEIMQYTGLKDSEGKEIYEGDICENDAICDYVEYIDGAYCFSKDVDSRQMTEHYPYKVIGNIYENYFLYLQIK
jgi:uncharacterized phage protein (TIGR01671 family)